MEEEDNAKIVELHMFKLVLSWKRSRSRPCQNSCQIEKTASDSLESYQGETLHTCLAEWGACGRVQNIKCER